MEVLRSEKLENFLDCEILRIEKEEAEKAAELERQKAEDVQKQEYKKFMLETIKNLENRFDSLVDEDKEYLEWLKS